MHRSERYCRFDFRLCEFVGASPRYLVLGLAIGVVGQFNCINAEQWRMHINLYLMPTGTDYKALSEI